MPFTDTATAPRIVDENSFDKEPSYPIVVGGTIYYRRVITSRYRHTILTQAAADSIAEAKNSETGTSAASQRMNEPGWFQVNVTKRTDCAWET